MLKILTIVIYISMKLSGITASRCPTNKKSWNEREVGFQCQGDKAYHCGLLMTMDVGEFCLKTGAVQPKVCPIFDNETITYVKCEVLGCPNIPYITSELYKFPLCFTLFEATTSNRAELTTIKEYLITSTNTNNKHTVLNFSSSSLTTLNDNDTDMLFTSREDKQIHVPGENNILKEWWLYALFVGSITFLVLFMTMVVAACILFRRTKIIDKAIAGLEGP